jgi:hypothetical protein
MMGSTSLLWLLCLGCLLGADAQHAPSLLSNCSYSYGAELFLALNQQEQRWSQLSPLPSSASQREWAGPASVLGLTPLPNGTASLKQVIDLCSMHWRTPDSQAHSVHTPLTPPSNTLL